MPIIIYNSNTGKTENYAKLLSEKLECECVSLSDSKKIAADEEIIFMSWVMNGSLEKYKDVKAKFTNIKAVCGVGMMPSEENANKVVAKSEVTEKFFLLAGGFDLKKLKGMHKMIMSMMIAKIKKEGGSAPSEKQLQMIKIFEEGFDLFNIECLEPVVDFCTVK
ncbi:MAG: flavodoxin domain-containing protein [Clostridia bacterium]